jgi:signal peptidase I
MSDWRQRWRGEAAEWIKTAAGALIAYLAFTTVAFAQYRIPSESMVPHIEVGDRVAVSKFAYGYSRYSLPFGAELLPASSERLFGSLPRRGDVIVFAHPRTGETMIKRAIGLPGDVIELHGGMLSINGRAVETTQAQLLIRAVHSHGREWAQRYEETLPEGRTHATHNLTDGGALDNFGPYTVPEGHVFAMGDNRDNSLDSRWDGMGPVPIENLIGRAEITVVTGFSPCGRDATVTCPMQRWMRPLHH